jgi:cytochrome c biogenesis protein CcmG/thiol:disulfide interchange protein DsbE
MSQKLWSTLKLGALLCLGAFLLWLSLVRPLLHKSDITHAAVPLVSGESVDIASLKGKVILLNFWGPDCPPCIHELPDLEKLYQKYHDNGFEVIGIAVAGSSPSKTLARAAMAGLTYPLAIDQDGRLAQAAGGITVTPTQVLIGRNGKVLDKIEGEVTNQGTMAEILQAIQQKP